MSEPFDDADLHGMLSVLDREAEPNPAFADRLEQQLLSALATPEPIVEPPARTVADAGQPLELVARDRFQPRWAWLAAVAVALVLVGLGLAGLRPGGRQQTITGPADEQAPTPTADGSESDGLASEPAPDSAPFDAETDEARGEREPRILGRRSVTDIAGILPDGTSYRVHVEPGVTPGVEAISAAIAIEGEDGRPKSIASARFEASDGETTFGFSADGREFWASSGGWTMTVELDDRFTAELAAMAEDRFGGDVERLLVESITSRPGGSMPRFGLEPPLRWAGDDEGGAAMEVGYADLTVRRGCGNSSVACNDRRSVQINAVETAVTKPDPQPTASETPRHWWIDSTAPRPPADEFWLDPGPLTARGDHQVLWTGREMIVWGGAESDRPAHLVEGAAFDPTTNRWRLLPPSPIQAPAYTVALWAGEEMLVLGLDATVAYDPIADSWSEVGEGIIPGNPIWTGSEVVTVNRTGVHRFDRDRGRWAELGDLNTGGDGQQPIDDWYGPTLQAVDGALFTRRGCSIVVKRWTGSDWEDVDPLPPSTDSSGYHFCPWANQWSVVDGKIVLWEAKGQPTVALDPADNTWSEIARIPLLPTEGPGGAIDLGNRMLATTWQSAIYDPAGDAWLPVELPGRSPSSNAVWTGEELLMWGGACCYGSSDQTLTVDAWRWTPPSPTD